MASKAAQINGGLSFAKVAMMNPPLNQHALASHQNMQSAESVADVPTKTIPIACSSDQRDLQHGDGDSSRMDKLSMGVQDLHLSRENSGTGGSEASGEDCPSKTDGIFDDDQTHLSNSSTKPTSFDSKSMASITTFAMDEKESLRPDDSASVQAIDEDDLSGSASGAPNSQVGSESSARLNRVGQLAMSQRFSGVAVVDVVRLNEGELKKLHGESTMNALNERDLHSFPNEPDEKLLEAMRSPKDRLFILQLEEKINAFIKNPSPTPLSTLYAANVMKTPPPAAPAMKIMRRVGQPGTSVAAGGSTAPSSSAPSKTTSEVDTDGSGEEGAESSAAATPAKERQALTREEREAKYQEARERIFRDFPESKSSDSPNNGEQSVEVSRSNSRAGRKKHRQRTPHDDSFEVRSQFSTYYAGVQYSGTQVPFGGAVHDSSFTPQSNYILGQPPASLNFTQNNQTAAIYPSQTNTNGFPHYPVAIAPQGNWQNGHVSTSQYTGFHQGNQLPVMSQQSSTRSSPAMSSYVLPTGVQYPQSPSSWTQTPYQSNYPSPTVQRNPQAVHWPNIPPNPMASAQIPYSYGQTQNQAYPQNPANNTPQHPLPGSFIRSTFNPQSRSFAPGAGISQPRYSENIASSQPSNGYSAINCLWTGGQDNVNRFQSRNSGHHVNNKPSVLPSSDQSSGPGRQTENQNSITKWGTPAHLPPKPPPSEVPYDFDRKARTSTVSAQNYSNNNTSTFSKPATSKSGPLVVGGPAPSNSRSQ
ncbi:hypothetical protein PRK78_001130 [Emydomyces testavorans]|uniref:SUZ domain-containing protein n=1 Tax=Emydomyces testavorans TaxID=2070801 RepID=A0AAF0DC31_9EURO|nr:hypothetical protein PRK78_001130 [Emydomyces testavorans]